MSAPDTVILVRTQVDALNRILRFCVCGESVMLEQGSDRSVLVTLEHADPIGSVFRICCGASDCMCGLKGELASVAVKT